MRHLLLVSMVVALASCLDFGGQVDRLCDGGAWAGCARDAGDVDAGDVDAGGTDAGEPDAGDVDAGLVDAGPCFGGTRGPWCWEAPVSTGSELTAVWGTDDALRVATAGGLVIEWNGADWLDRGDLLPPLTPSAAGPPAFLGRVSSAAGTYLFGQHTPVLQWNGSAFISTALNRDFVAAGGATSRTVFASTDATLYVLPSDGGVATTLVVPALSGELPVDVHATDTSCLVALWQAKVVTCANDVTTLTYVDGGAPLLSAFVTRADGGLAIAASGGHLFDLLPDGGWEAEVAPTSEMFLGGAPYLGQTRLVGTSGIVYDFESSTQVNQDYQPDLTRAHATADTFWAVGGAGVVVRYDGAMESVPSDDRTRVRGLWVHGDAVTAGTLGGYVLQRTGPRQWSREMVPGAYPVIATWTDGERVLALDGYGELFDMTDPHHKTRLADLMVGHVSNGKPRAAPMVERDGEVWGIADDELFRLPLDGGAANHVRLEDAGTYASDLELADGGLLVVMNDVASGQPAMGRVRYVQWGPGSPSSTLMLANVSGGAALHDLAVAAEDTWWIAGDGVLGRVTNLQYFPESSLVSREWVGVWLDRAGAPWAVDSSGVVVHRGALADGGVGWVTENPTWNGEEARPSSLVGDGTTLWMSGEHGAILRRPLP